MRYSFFCLSALLLLTVGCSSPKDANEKNFVRVINEYYQDHCLDVTFYDAKFPKVVKSRYPEKQLQALVAVGLLSSRDTTAQQMSLRGEDSPVAAKIYELTSEGRKFYFQRDGGVLLGTVRGFCAGTFQVDKLIGFSAPAPAYNGVTISNVTVECSPLTVHEWALDKDLQRAFPGLKSALEPHRKQAHVLVLMNDGWIHSDDYISMK